MNVLDISSSDLPKREKSEAVRLAEAHGNGGSKLAESGNEEESGE